MTDLMVFSIRNITPWWRYIIDNLTCAKSTCIVTDVRNDPLADVSMVDDVYHNLKKNDCKKIAIEEFGLDDCQDIIARCRVLRNLSEDLALKLIGARVLTVRPIIEKNKPALIASLIIDRYTNDVVARIAHKYNIQFLEMTASILPDYVMFMSRGQYFPVRIATSAEVSQSLTVLKNEHFTPSYVDRSAKFGLLKYLKVFCYFKLRSLYFNILRYVQNDKYNLHYLDALNYLDHKPRMLDIMVLWYFDKNWQEKLEKSPAEKNVFIAMQLLPEASLDYWLADCSLLDNDKVILKAAEVLTRAGYKVFIKDHPLQFGFRKRKIIQQLAKMPNVVLVPYEVPASIILKKCNISFTLTGTVGFQALFYNSKSIVSNAYYADQDNFIHINNLTEINHLPELVEKFKNKVNNPEQVDKVISAAVERLLAASVPGDLFTFKKFNKNNPEHKNKIQDLVQSLDKCFDKLINKEREEVLQ